MTFRTMRLATALTATFAGLPGQAEAEPTTSQPPAQTKFAWRIPSSVTVTEDALKKGRPSKLRYQLAMTKRDGGGFRVKYGNFQFLEFDGRDVTSPEMQKVLAPATAMASAIPDLLIRDDGTFEKADGIHECMERVVQFMAKTRGWGDDEKDRMRKMMTSPMMTAVMSDSVSRYWNCWVGAWVDCNLPAGETRTDKKVSMMLGNKIEADVVSNHEQADGVSTIRRTARFEGKKFARSMLAFMNELAPLVQMSGDIDKAEERFEVSVVDSYSVVTDPKTLLPRKASMERKIVLLDLEENAKHEQLERHSYAFDWGNQAKTTGK